MIIVFPYLWFCIIFSDNYQYLCTINASDPGLQIRLSRQKNRNGRTFYKLKFDVVISFSLNEMKAQIAWREKVKILIFFARVLIKPLCSDCRESREGERLPLILGYEANSVEFKEPQPQ
jgi:hypothetical protein